MKQREAVIGILLGAALMVLIGVIGIGYTVWSITISSPSSWMLWIMVGVVDVVCLRAEWIIGTGVRALWKGRG